MADREFSMANSAPLIALLQGLPGKIEKKALSASMRKGAAIVRNAAVTRAKQFDDPKTPAKIWKEIAVRTNAKLGRQEGGVALQVGVKGGAKEYKNNAQNRREGRVGKGYEGPGAVFYWRFLEFGTRFMKAQPFMRPALSENVESATAAIVAELDKRITQITSAP